MLNEKDYPVFFYFMESYMCDYIDYYEQAKEFKKHSSKKKCEELHKEIENLKTQDTCDIQAFIKRKFGRGLKQKEICNTFDTILNGLESK